MGFKNLVGEKLVRNMDLGCESMGSARDGLPGYRAV